MTTFEFGQVVLVRFPFTDQVRSKQRPAAVIWRAGRAGRPPALAAAADRALALIAAPDGRP
jgi:hypothetical protein